LWKSSRPTIPTSNKEYAKWKDKEKKAYVVIVVKSSEEVSHHIVSINDSYGALKKLKDSYDSHSKLELVQVLVKRFNLELKNDDPMALASKIKAIMHDNYSIRVNIGIPFIDFIKSLYPKYSHYHESLEASGQMKSITFHTLVEKVTKCEKSFGNKSS
jgi:hypothetical protein